MPLPNLRIENTGHLPFEEWRLHYGPAGERDIPIERVACAREVRTRIDSMIYEHLDDGRAPEAHLILPLLHETIEEVCIKLGGGQTGDLGIVLAYEVARYIAGVTEGLISPCGCFRSRPWRSAGRPLQRDIRQQVARQNCL
jgi:hypothetical protein